MEKITGISRKTEERLNSEAESLFKTLVNNIPEKTRLVTLVYVLANMLASIFQTQCEDVPRDELSNLIKQTVDIITHTEFAQQQKEEEQDTPDENQEPQPQL